MTQNIGFRQMRKDETSKVVALISSAMNENEGKWASDTISFHFFCDENKRNDGREYFVAELENSIVGIVGLHRYIWGPKDTTWLGWFAVAKEHQNKKIGYFLMKKITEYAREKNYRQLLVETYSDATFEKARLFYEKFGFKTVGKVENYIEEGVDMVVFGLKL